MPTIPVLSPRIFKENKMQGPQGYTGEQASNRKCTLTKAYAGHQSREWTRSPEEVVNISNAIHLCFKTHFHELFYLTLSPES